MLDLLIHICKCQSLIANIPIKLYLKDNLIESFDPYSYIIDVDLTRPYLKQLHETDKHLNYCITPDLLIMGLVRQKSSPYSFVIGPGCIGEITDHTTGKLIASGQYPLKLDQAKKLTRYLRRYSDMDIIKFTHLLSLIYANINQEVIPPNSILTSETEYFIEDEIEHTMLEKDEEISYSGQIRRNPYDYETEMLYCIKHGLTTRLKKLTLKANISETGVLALDTLRHYKNAVIIQNSLSVRAGIAGGLNPETSYQLGEIYIRKIEACKNLKELGTLSSSIRLDYCERVRELQYPNTHDPAINKAMHYINENIHEKISAQKIATMLSFTKEYLSLRFKEVTNLTIPEYINKHKIKEGKRLLRLTDKPISEISEYLSYSSQSHFQNTFKKFEGITPLAYRNSPRDSII